ncbi:MAG: peptidylprolyl isomerase [Rhizobiales bacterium]|nr:peptidylprolyl isomerase [Hyphomicrobiales bacterium]
MGCSVASPLHSLKPGLVSVNGVVIPRDEIAREAQNHPTPSPAEAFKVASQALVVRELLLQEAKRLNVEWHALEDERGRRETDTDAMIRALTEQEVTTPEPDEASCRKYYENNRGRFSSSPLWEAAHILFGASRHDRKAYAAAREMAQVASDLLTKDPRRFAELARQHSSCSSAAQDGNLGQIARGRTTPEFETALAVLSPGQLSPPVASRYGFHIIRLDRYMPGQPLPYEAVAERIASYLAEKMRHRAIAQYIARLVSRSRISGINLPNIELNFA